MTDGSTSPELLEQHLASHDEACPSCDYNLRDLHGDRCPECGQGLKLVVALTTPNYAAFIAGLVALASAIGFNSFMTIWATVIYFVQIMGGPKITELVLMAVLAVTPIVLLVMWIRHSRRLRRQPALTRWGLAAACGAVPIVSFVIIFTIAT